MSRNGAGWGRQLGRQLGRTPLGFERGLEGGWGCGEQQMGSSAPLNTFPPQGRSTASCSADYGTASCQSSARVQHRPRQAWICLLQAGGYGGGGLGGGMLVHFPPHITAVICQWGRALRYFRHYLLYGFCKAEAVYVSVDVMAIQ